MKKIITILIFLFSLNGLMAQETVNTSHKIIIYGSDECHHCIETKEILKEHKIDFTFYDIDKNETALQEMLAKLRSKNISTSNLGIPVVDNNGELFSNNEDFDTFIKKIIDDKKD